MNLWSTPGVPHKGWRWVNVIDLQVEEENYEKCEMCGRENIRYVHVMEHDDYDSELRVGCVCAENMSGDYLRPKQRERELRNLTARRTKWLTRRWRISIKGNQFLNVDGYNVSIFPDKFHNGKWKYRIDQEFSKGRYNTPEEAKLAIFDHLYNL